MSHLTQCQKKAIEGFKDFLKDPDSKEFVLTGAGGTGKTWLMQYAADLAQKTWTVSKHIKPGMRTPRLFFTATTHKAAAVLKKLTRQQTQTIHSLLALKVKNDYKTGTTRLETTATTHSIQNALVFIDEASMVDYRLLQLIRAYLSESKVVFIGDPYQLPPVQEQPPKIFSNPVHRHELKEIKRQDKNNPIIALAQKFRDCLNNNVFDWPEFISDGKHIQVITGPEFEQLVTDKFGSPHEPDEYRVLAWSNEKVVAYNRFIHNLQTGSTLLQLGDRAITNKPVLNGGMAMYPTDTEHEITDCKPATDRNVSGYAYQLNHEITLFAPADQQQYRDLLKYYAAQKDWANYFYIKDIWADLRPIHSLTVHKSQGSTYREVFIDVGDIGRNTRGSEICRLMYVALTRASDKVYLYGSLPYRNPGKR